MKNIYCVKFNADISTSISGSQMPSSKESAIKTRSNSPSQKRAICEEKKELEYIFFGYSSSDESDNDDSDRSDWLP